MYGINFKNSLAIKLSLLFTILLNISSESLALNMSLSCADMAGDSFDVERISGEWYEIVRIPAADVPACVKVTAPKSTENDNYNLQVDYINNSNRKWDRTTENLTFPWNDITQNGIFELNYGSITIVFKLVATDYDNIALVCGYASIASGAALAKVLTRQPTVNSTIKDQIQILMDTYEINAELTWVEQSAKCAAATHFVSSLEFVSVLVLILINLHKEINS